MIISIEGLDGVGKTSLVNSLSEELGIPTLVKPINKLLNLKKEQSTEIKEKLYSDYSESMQAMYYLFGNLSALEFGRNNDIILDRGFISTYYFSYCEKNSKLYDFFAENYGFPDITILLYASIEKRISRIKNRNKEDRDLKAKRIYTDGYNKYFEAIRKYDIPCIAINTEQLTENEVKKIALMILEKMKLGNKQSMMKKFSIDNLESNNLSFNEMVEKIEFNDKIIVKGIMKDGENSNKF